MAIIERDAVSFDVLLLEFARPESDPELIEAGRRVCRSISSLCLLGLELRGLRPSLVG